jgi:hypothetical protein
MIRRTFRLGVLLGIAAGAAGAVKKAMESRKPAAAPASGSAWPPIAGAEPVTVPAAPAPEQSRVVPAEPEGDTEVHEGEEAEEHFAATERQPEERTPDWTPNVADLQEAPAPAPPAKKAAKKKAAAKKAAPKTPWVEPDADGGCPGSHPVKGKLASKIFHLPGGFNYPRTRPDRCYVDAAAAEADGLRPSKR